MKKPTDYLLARIAEQPTCKTCGAAHDWRTGSRMYYKTLMCGICKPIRTRKQHDCEPFEDRLASLEKQYCDLRRGLEKAQEIILKFSDRINRLESIANSFRNNA